jgi:Spy/CpxP family protein refolding chaperone
MNRWIQRVVTFTSLAGTLALLPAGVAFAQEAPPQGQHGHGHHRGGERQGLLGAALKLESLTPAQRGQIEQLVAGERTARTPVRQADAQVLTVLAQQVEAAKVDEAALAPSLTVKRTAVMAEKQVDQAALAQLHSILTPAQRGELVDRIEARVAEHQGNRQGKGGHWEGKGGGEAGRLGLSDQQKAQLRANLQAEGGGRRAERGAGQQAAEHGQRKAALESFRGDSFQPGAMAHSGRGEGRELRMTEALIPVLTPNQRATLATQLRNRAAKMSRS